MAVKYKKISLVNSFSCPTGESSGKVLYNMDSRSPDWKGWRFAVNGYLLSVTPPNGYCTTDIPLVHVKMLVREADPVDAPVARRPAA